MSKRVSSATALFAVVFAAAVIAGPAETARADEQGATAARPMRVALIGASGNVGSRILTELVSRGHAVTGIARTPASIAAGPRVAAVAGDVNEPVALAKSLAGHDAVISAAPFRNTDPDVLIGAVRTSGVKRYIIVGGAATLMNAEGQRLLDTPALAKFKESPEPAGGARFLEAIRKVTDLDWTFFSPAVNFAPGPRTGKFRLGGDTVVTDPQGQSRVSMEDYAIALVDELEKPAHIRQRFTVGY
jgi:putative NADH-flavin reductase